MKKLIIGMIVLVAIAIAVGVFVWPDFFYDTAERVGYTIKPVPSELTITYPPELTTKYVFAQEWPPKFSWSLQTELKCEAGFGGQGIIGPTDVVAKTINNKKYCLETQRQGAAGTTYTTYVYGTMLGSKMAVVTFTLGTPQCDNYDDPLKGECKKEQAAFDPDNIASQVINGVRIN